MPLPSNNTSCGFLDYSVAGYDHTLMVRCDEGVSDGDLIANINAFVTIVGAFCYPTTVIGFRRRDKNSIVSYGVPWTGITSWGSGTAIPAVTAQFYDFVGRSANGFRARVALFGAGLNTSGGDFRVTPAEASWVGDAIASLTSDAAIFLTIAGDNPAWKNYANCGPNAYWRNKVR